MNLIDFFDESNEAKQETVKQEEAKQPKQETVKQPKLKVKPVKRKRKKEVVDHKHILLTIRKIDDMLLDICCTDNEEEYYTESCRKQELNFVDTIFDMMVKCYKIGKRSQQELKKRFIDKTIYSGLFTGYLDYLKLNEREIYREYELSLYSSVNTALSYFGIKREIKIYDFAPNKM